jgi:hypothetical protein
VVGRLLLLATIEIICKLGDSKDTVNHFYFLQGLKKLLITQSVFQFKEDKGISDNAWREIIDAIDSICFRELLVTSSFICVIILYSSFIIGR